MIVAIRAEEDIDLDDLTAMNVRQKVKDKEKVVDPFALSFLTEQLIGMGKMSIKDESQTLVSLYEIFLSLSVLFGADLKAKTSEVMLQTCLDIMRMAHENIADIEENDDMLGQFINNQLMKWVCSGLNFDTTFKVNKRKNKIM